MQQCCKSNHYLFKCNIVALKFQKIIESVRSTTTKTEIQELIVSSSVALSHSEIQKSLKGLCDSVTICRVLERLSKGVVRPIFSQTQFCLALVMQALPTKLCFVLGLPSTSLGQV